MTSITVQPSELDISSAIVASEWYRGIPKAGVASVPIPAVGGQPDCTNLIAGSPPTLLEEYSFYAFSIAWQIFLSNGAAYGTAPVITAEIALLVNDRVEYSTTQQQVSEIDFDGATALGTFSGDLVNPIRVGGRERLSLRVGLLSDTAAAVGGFIVVAAQSSASAGNVSGVESTLSYTTLELPARRRL